MSKTFLIWGSGSALLAVMTGAFGSHGLKEVLDPYSKSIYQTAVLYQMFHALGICLVAVASKGWKEKRFHLSGWFFILGTVFFSGSLYTLALTGIKWLGAITPIGGILFILGWAQLIRVGISLKER